MEDADKPEYESPVIFDYGEFGELTQQHPSEDPLHDPHMLGSITPGHH